MKNRTRSQKNSKRIARFVCLAVCLATIMSMCALTMVSCASNDASGELTYIKVAKDGESITAKIPVSESIESKDIFLFGIDPWQNSNDLSDIQPLTDAKIKSGEAKAKIKVNGNLSEMLCKGYLFAKKESSGTYTPITGVYYVTNPEAVSGKAEDNGSVGIKGAIGSVSQLFDLGAGSTVVTVNLSSLMNVEGGEGSIPYTWSGLTYYANRAAIDALDKQIRDYTNAGIYVYLEIVQTEAKEDLPERIQSIVFDAPKEKNGYALNMSNREGVSRISGMLEFLAERYGNGGNNGKASAFIMGRNVNNTVEWYAGSPEKEEGIFNYAKLVRTAYNILLSHTPDAKVYIALDNNWNVAKEGALTIRDMMIGFNNQVGSEGDFFWQVSIEANASDRADSSIWDDPNTEGKTDFISPSNIETLLNQLSTGMYKCAGAQRHVLLNHFAIGGTNEDERAASYAYAYYKCLSNGTVDGLVYDNLNDELTGILPTGNGDAKKIASVISTIDDDSCVDLSFVSSLIGEKWSRLYNKYSAGAAISSTKKANGGNAHSNNGGSTITDFSGGNMFGFASSVSSKYTELRYSEDKNAPALYTALAQNGTWDRSGVISSSLNKKALKDAGYLGISVKVDSTESSATVTLRLSGYDKKDKEHVFVGETVITTNEWTEIYFDIKEFADSIDEDTVMISVMTRSNDKSEATTGLWVSKMVTEAPAEEGFPVWAIIVIIAVAVVGVGVVFFLWFKKNYTFVKE